MLLFKRPRLVKCSNCGATLEYNDGDILTVILTGEKIITCPDCARVIYLEKEATNNDSNA
jgi:predicted  nucleic acid-binding Zn-ribbon protein